MSKLRHRLQSTHDWDWMDEDTKNYIKKIKSNQMLWYLYQTGALKAPGILYTKYYASV